MSIRSHIGRALGILGSKLVDPPREPGFPDIGGPVAMELTEAGGAMIARPRRERETIAPPPPLEGSAADLIARRNGRVRD